MGDKEFIVSRHSVSAWTVYQALTHRIQDRNRHASAGTKPEACE
jgi:hypothetical protein